MSSRPLTTSLRLSLLASLGLLPLACGGASQHGNPNGNEGGTESGGTSPTAGTTSGGSVGHGGASGGGGGAQGGTGGSVGHGGAGGDESVPACTSPKTDPVTGIVTCQEGYIYRTRSTRCVTTTAGDAAPAPDPRLPRVDTYVDCTEDATVCDAYEYGYCASDGAPSTGRMCASGCLLDSDCGVGQMCRCEGEKFGVCTYDKCDADADCDNGYHCAAYPGACSYEPFACQAPEDDCADCGMNDGFMACQMQADGHRACTPSGVCGRPFLVEDCARVASVVARGDWADGRLAGPRLDHLTADERATLAQHWTRMGQLEHASIAAFARFQLQLLALGAPPELVEACTQALADETAHTQLCFALASAYAGRALGPGPLDVDGSLNVTSLGDIVQLVIAEGCFGETNAALEALEARDTATDPLIADTYARIAADEQRHAELAFRFVRWALEQGGRAVADRVAGAIDAPPPSARAAHAVTVPCLQALLAQTELVADRDQASAPVI
jgi:hypothetical protein